MDIPEPIQNRLKPLEIRERLEIFKAEIRFPSIKPPDKISDILNKLIDISTLKVLTAEQLSEHMVLLAGYNLYLCEQENRLIATINWCESNIKYIIGKNVDQIEGFFTEKELKIRANEQNAQELEKIKLEMQVKLDSIKNLGFKIDFVTNNLKNLYYERRTWKGQKNG